MALTDQSPAKSNQPQSGCDRPNHSHVPKLSVIKKDILESRSLEACNHCISGSPTPSALATHSVTEELEESVLYVLTELGRLQAKRRDAPAQKQYKYKRYVVGFREVDRALHRGELKGVIFAPNIEQSDVVHSTVSDILETAKLRNVPCIFALNRRKIGKALGKSIKQSAVGIWSTEGVHHKWKELLTIFDKLVTESTDGPIDIP